MAPHSNIISPNSQLMETVQQLKSYISILEIRFEERFKKKQEFYEEKLKKQQDDTN